MAVGHLKLGVIGGGAMAEALVAGALGQNLYLPHEILVSEPNPTRRAYWQSQYGITATAHNNEAANAELLLLAIKPQVLTEVVAGLVFPLQTGMVVSILAGVSLEQLAQLFPQVPLVRAMPNTPALVGAGITALASLPGVSSLDRVEQLFRAVGTVVFVPERLMDGVTGLSGSGPAYVALFAEALMDGGVAAGLPRDIARELTLATITGSIALMRQENLHPAQLKDRVTSPGGTTIAGLTVLEQAAVRGALIQAVVAAAQRAQDLGKS